MPRLAKKNWPQNDERNKTMSKIDVQLDIRFIR